MTADVAFTIGLAAGWVALVVALVWPTPHCKCCRAGQDEGREGSREIR